MAGAGSRPGARRPTLLVVDDSRLGSDGLAQSDSVELYAGDPATGAAKVSSYGGWHKSSTNSLDLMWAGFFAG